VIDQDRLGITITRAVLFADGATAEDRSTADLSGREIEIVIDLNVGDATATILTTDLSHEYVEENSAYSS
jgi:glutamate N-acetyltransferase/amino-acid N-acetyltransferase